MTTPLPLQDIHPGLAPAWWPPAPGWWMLAAVLLVTITALAWWRRRRRRRETVILGLFDDAVARAETPAQQVAAMSDLLRRAARRRDSGADRLDGDAWLQFLDDDFPDRPFSKGAGSLLLDGAFRADVPEGAAAALRVLARRRYRAWMQRK